MVEDQAKGWNTPPPPQPVEPIEALENQGEFPDRFSDQGEKSAGPIRKAVKPKAPKPEVAKPKLSKITKPGKPKK